MSIILILKAKEKRITKKVCLSIFARLADANYENYHVCHH